MRNKVISYIFACPLILVNWISMLQERWLSHTFRGRSLCRGNWSQRFVPSYMVVFYLRQGKRSEHWRRLRVWSFCPSVRLCAYMMFHNGNNVIAPTLAITFPSLSPATNRLFFSLPFSCCRFPSCSCSCRSSSSNVWITLLGGDMHSHERLEVALAICFLAAKHMTSVNQLIHLNSYFFPFHAHVFMFFLNLRRWGVVYVCDLNVSKTFQQMEEVFVATTCNIKLL